VSGSVPGPAVHLDLDLHAEPLAVCRLRPDAPTPSWVEIARGPLVSITRTRHELSLVVLQELVPPGVDAETGWRALSVRGPLAFSLTGVLASLAAPLADAGVPIFVVSTFETDWLLVDAIRLEHAVASLEAAGHRVHRAIERSRSPSR
jgi:uncharacterized protein